MPLIPISTLMLLVVNLLPLAGVLFWGWSVFEIMVLYWLENVVIGVLNVIKMLTVMFLNKDFSAIVSVPFFSVHYGGFTAIHGLFVLSMFAPEGKKNAFEALNQSMPAGLDHNDPWPMINYLEDIIQTNHLGYALMGIAISHTLSYALNFVLAGEYKKSDCGKLMGAPYGRVILLHITIIIGGGAAMASGQPAWALLLLVGMKTIFDMAIHIKRHKKEQSQSGNI